ncbi:MAG: tRNA guanosine(34) transglycosylase Tgt [Propionibacteriaceae bacterium]|nr:tRNA guanosine(34) transglycosylase Tgt [Propionibacteriaceae bacterium]
MPATSTPTQLNAATGFSFEITATLPAGQGRAGIIHTPHGDIATPAFIPVGTQASVKAVLPEQIRDLGAQAVLANAFHLYLQPGADIVDVAGGLGAFMNWPGPTYTDSGGFQVMSLGSGFKKVIEMEAVPRADDKASAGGRKRLSNVDEDGVDFRSPRDGSRHRFTAEVSMGIQHRLGADIMFCFDELTTLANTYPYHEASLRRTQRWAERCLAEHVRLTYERVGKPYQALFAVVQGAQYEDLRRTACRGLAATEHEGWRFDGYGIGGALEKHAIGEIVGWCAEELPVDKPRHLLGISEPEDVFVAVAAGADTFDCVMPSRVARNAAVYTATGRYNVDNAAYRRDFGPLEDGCDCYTCTHYTRAYLHHAFKAREMIAATLATIHNERFTVRLVDDIRNAIETGVFAECRDAFFAHYRRRQVQ